MALRPKGRQLLVSEWLEDEDGSRLPLTKRYNRTPKADPQEEWGGFDLQEHRKGKLGKGKGLLVGKGGYLRMIWKGGWEVVSLR